MSQILIQLTQGIDVLVPIYGVLYTYTQRERGRGTECIERENVCESLHVFLNTRCWEEKQERISALVPCCPSLEMVLVSI